MQRSRRETCEGTLTMAPNGGQDKGWRSAIPSSTLREDPLSGCTPHGPALASPQGKVMLCHTLPKGHLKPRRQAQMSRNPQVPDFSTLQAMCPWRAQSLSLAVHSGKGSKVRRSPFPSRAAEERKGSSSRPREPTADHLSGEVSLDSLRERQHPEQAAPEAVTRGPWVQEQDQWRRPRGHTCRDCSPASSLAALALPRRAAFPQSSVDCWLLSFGS